MKIRYFFYVLFVVGLLFCTISCLDLFDNKEDEELSPDQAKIEIRSANQRIQAENDELMDMPGYVALNYLADLTSNESWKTSLASVLNDSEHITYHKVKDIFVKDNQSRSVQEDYLQNLSDTRKHPGPLSHRRHHHHHKTTYFLVQHFSICLIEFEK